MSSGPVGDAPDHGTLEGLFHAHYARLVRHLSLIVGSRETAADALQDAFAQAHVRWRKVSRYGDPVGWIRRVAINRIRNHQRSSARSSRAITRLGPPPASDSTNQVVVRADVDHALRSLSPRQRTAVVLHHLEGLTVAETAYEMGVSAGSVKAHLSRARKALRPLLEDSDAR